MRGKIPAFVIAVVLSSCNPSRQQNDSSANGNGDIEADTMELTVDSDGAIPPSSADEYFDDFIYSFMSNREYQMSRITFPLPYTNEQTTTFIDRSRWRFDQIYANEEFFVTIFDNPESMRLEKDTTLNRVNVTWLFLKNGTTKEYEFEKVSGRWSLARLEINKVEKSHDADFLSFYMRFASDDNYQKAHIAQSIEFKTYDDENLQSVNGYVEAEQWKSFRPYIPTEAFASVDYGQTADKGDTRYFVMRGIANSMMTVLHFQKQAGRWTLIAFEN